MGKENWCQIVNWEGKDLKVEAIVPGEWGKEKQGKRCWEMEWGKATAYGRLKVTSGNVG